jgi:hypothetical protein
VKAQGATVFGSVISGVLASACCIGPLVFALLGISGAAFAHRFDRRGAHDRFPGLFGLSVLRSFS